MNVIKDPRDWSKTDFFDLTNSVDADIATLESAIKSGDPKAIYEARRRLQCTINDDDGFSKWLEENPRPA